MYQALKIIVTGRIQGVGFRPFIYSLAKKYSLRGTVQNNLGTVQIIAEGKQAALSEMVQELTFSHPPLAKIDELTTHQLAPSYYEDFTIIASEESGNALPWVSPDAAICVDCLEEFSNPENRRYLYPFINCTQCGPRYTITERLPYDRTHTTMKEFEMCGRCREEYDDPTSRRHHAQPICCAECGPALKLYHTAGDVISGDQGEITQVIDLIKQGKIVGIKGIGGYHLACDAFQEKVVARLRLKKRRPKRPLAIMVKSLAVARKFCHLSKQEEETLTGQTRPIVVLRKKAEGTLPDLLSPGLSTIGIMLPYTPLHYLLFENNELDCLVMTSANPSGFPIQYKDESLHDLADYVLTHDRKIHLPIDDSLVQWDGDRLLHLRNGRGLVPDPIKTNDQVDDIIALGGQQKNTFALGRQNHVIMSPHIGDLDNEEMIEHFESQLSHYRKWLGVEAAYAAVDKHPLYTTTSLAKNLTSHVIPVQHHHAHHVSCMEENGLGEPSLGIILDGTGYGDDGHLWGFEFLYGNADSFERLAHLHYSPLPGGEKAVKEPWRNAVGMLLNGCPEEGKKLSVELFPEKTKQIHIIEQMVKQQIHSPMAGSCGRLFDAVSAILGINHHSTYEGEPAITLSDYMNRRSTHSSNKIYTYSIHTGKPVMQIDFYSMIHEIVQDKLNNVPPSLIIEAFHNTIISCCIEMIQKLVKRRPDLNKNVVLSGGSFQNIYLTRHIQKRLHLEGFTVYTHNKVPCHDGGLSLGQLIIASRAVNK
ncbi:carbamoyltransferase [Halobacillus andaensis]|uniref:Carbamoyltransferase n=1 Tax=Halobacillus andaensis TaxID=1176239 RepID=A0A917EV16_HALAA|nr:carbamoyltransferase HypF [Halobacillus andaensis]MBP2004821.1 hydrogenase maturation protein HypF [Halobacillus andaensis]GGF18642.1 carbamoyltransferase [Halobacillus andaensis]